MRTRDAVCFALVTSSAGCLSHVPRTHPDLEELTASFRADNAAGVARRDSVARARLGRVEVGGSPTARTLTVDVTNAPVADVLRRALTLAGQPFAFEGTGPAGRVTAAFSDRPLLDGVNALLASAGQSASIQNGLLSVRSGTASAASDSETVSIDVPIEHMDAAMTAAVVEGFLRAGALKAVYQPTRSTVMLQGPRREVTQAAATLQRADRAPGHVLLEALVVEFDVESLRDLGVSFSGGKNGNFSEMLLSPGNFGGVLFQFLHQKGVSSPKQFVAAVQALAGNEKARIVARPYISTRSGQAAAVEVGTNRTYTTQNFQGGMVASGTTTVQTGVVLKITPTSIPGDQVRVDLSVEESQFIPTVSNAAAETDRNFASTSMQVPSGQTIAIGGLVLDRESRGNAGMPLLRHIPILNILTGRHNHTMKNQEVVIFVTPHIWEPGMTLPLATPGAFIEGKDRIKGGKGGEY